MPREDATRWNERYSTNDSPDLQTPRPFLLEHLHLLPIRGLALDLAMGAGKNSGALIGHGLDVVGVDISGAALRTAKRIYPELMAVLADLTRFPLPSSRFDVVLNFYYLQRDLWPEFRRILKPGGVLVFETLTRPMIERRSGITPGFLLEEAELKEAFSAWDILVYREGWVTSGNGHEKSVASMVARLPDHLQGGKTL